MLIRPGIVRGTIQRRQALRPRRCFVGAPRSGRDREHVYTVCLGYAGVLPVFRARPLIAQEVEQLVLADGAANRASELILIERLTATLRVEIIVRIENRIAQEFKRRPVNLIGARLGDHVHVRARVPPVAGVEVRSLHLEFLNCIRARNRDSRINAGDVVG